MSKKWRLAVAAACGVLVLAGGGGLLWALLGGKGESRVQIAQAENEYHPVYHSFCTYEHDPEIAIDALLEEPQWQGKQWYSTTYSTNVTGQLPTLKVTGFPMEKGVYIAAVVEDTNLWHNGELAPGANSNWEINLLAGDQEEISYARLCFNIDMLGQCFGPCTNFERAVRVEGELNSGNTSSATLEMFVPWEALKVDTSLGVPDTFYCYPSYRSVLPGKSETTVMDMIAGTNQLKDYYLFTGKGYHNIDREGAVVGDSAVGLAKSGNWDISREAEGIVESSPGTEHHQIFFTGQYGQDFIVETKLTYVKSLENWWPKAGILFKGTDSTWYTVYMDLRDGVTSGNDRGTRNFDTLMITTVDHTWNWRELSAFNKPNTSAVKDEVKLTVLKYGNRFFYFVNDIYFTSEEISFMGNQVMPGFYSLGADVIYKDYSCRELTEDILKEELNGKEIYLVDLDTAGAGGFAGSSHEAVRKGESYQVSLTSMSGYEVSSLLVNGQERIEDARENAVNGVYTIGNVQENQQVQVSFAQCEGAVFAGTVSNGESGVAATVSVKGKTNGALSYEVSGNGTWSLELPEGEYEVMVSARDCKNQTFMVDVKGDLEKEVTLEKSDFPSIVELNGKNMQTGKERWNLTWENYDQVVTSWAAGAKLVPLYFEDTATDFVVQSSIEYTTEFTGDASAYQPDLMGGFYMANEDQSGWVVARENGIVYTNWQYMGGLYWDKALSYPTKKGIGFTLAKVGDEAYLYFDGILAYKTSWSDLSGGMDPDREMAVGLVMIADKTADIRFSHYSFQPGTAAATQYVESHGARSQSIAGCPMFATNVVIGGENRFSYLDPWNLSRAAEGIVETSFDAGGKLMPLYFKNHGSAVMAHATIEYTTEFTGAESEYQPDLFGGFVITDGKHDGFIMANSTGVVTGDWQWRMGMVPGPVLRYPDKRKVDLTVVLQGHYFHIFFDGEYVGKLQTSWAVPGVEEGADMAFGLYMLADKTADIRFSNISITSDEAEVNQFMSQYR